MKDKGAHNLNKRNQEQANLHNKGPVALRTEHVLFRA